jgi:hypothetical protein
VPVAADVLFGRPGNNPFCHHRALELARQGLRERIVRTQAPEGLPFDHGRFEIVEEPWPAPPQGPASHTAKSAALTWMCKTAPVTWRSA